MYAVIRASGAQYKVSKGDELDLFHLEGKKEGDTVEFSDVLLVNDEGKTLVGHPLVLGAVVNARVDQLLKGDKIRVATFKAKSRHRRTIGHRDQLTRVKIMDIMISKQKTISKKQENIA